MRTKYEERKTNYKEIMNKKLEKLYVIVQVVSFEGEILENTKVTMIYGFNILGIKTIIGIYKENTENVRYWLEEIEKIKRRGLEKIIYISMEKNKRLEQAIKIVYNAEVKQSINETVEKIAKYTQYKWKSMGERELVEAYLSNDEKEFTKNIEELKNKYKENKIGTKLIEEFAKRTIKEIKEDKRIRHLMCSYCTKRRLKQAMINAVKEKIEIENIEELIETRAEYLTMFERTRSYSKEKWTNILNKIYETKYEEIEEYL